MRYDVFRSCAKWNRSPASGAVFAILTLVVGLSAGSRPGPAKATSTDPALLVPWTRIGDIALGKSKARVQREYGSPGHGFHVIQRYGNALQGFYRLHGSKVVVTFYGDHVGEFAFGTPYYRTTAGFGVGSPIPLGPCHRTRRSRCDHLWRGFVYNAWSREKPCGCWTKVGLGRRSLPATSDNFLKPWFIIYVERGRVTAFDFDLKYVD